MKCPKCRAKLRKRIIQPYGIKESVTVYECVSALCDYDEDECRRRRWPYRERPR